MSRSARVQQIIEQAASLTADEQEELAAELLERERARKRLEAGQAFLDECLAEVGPIPEDEVARIRREWPRD
jgi:hypothetical protein